MKKLSAYFILFFSLHTLCAQNVMTPEALWQLGRVSAIGISNDNQSIIYRVSTPVMSENRSSSKMYAVSVNGGAAKEITEYTGMIRDKNISPDGKYLLYSDQVKISKVFGSDFHPDMDKSNAMLYDGLFYRHWDTYADGQYNHVFFRANTTGSTGTDIMENEPYHAPQMPFGGDEDYIWSPDSKKIIYVSKKKVATASAQSTNSDLYEYNIDSKTTVNLTEQNTGFDTHPHFSPSGDLTWLQMKRDGYEADKNDIVVRHKGIDINLTAGWDGNVNAFTWSPDGKKVYFTAATNGTLQLFEVNFPGLTKIAIQVKQVTSGDFDVTSIIGFVGTKVFVTRTDFNHAAEIFSYDLKSKAWQQITQVNTDYYNSIAMSKTERRWVATTDGKQMLVWVIYPPNFDPSKKYPTLLYCQGGPQSALTQYYSYRWNFQTMAAQGYIVVAPNRRGMPGHGVEWNEEISKDWGGQVMDDYLAAIDDMAKEPFVDKERLAAVGASYGGYSVFQLAGIHNKRFKTFIAHAGIFNNQSFYGTTEELFFANWDMGGPYWEAANSKTYDAFNPITHIKKWDTPILIIHGAKDYRVPIGQGQEAFQAAQLLGIKSRFLYFPEENHWILKPQNAIVWQREFFRWLDETL